MTSKEIRKFIGKKVKFQTKRDRYYMSIDRYRYGEVIEIIRREVFIENDWYTSRDIVSMEIIKEEI